MITLVSNIWQSHPQAYVIKADTFFSFDFAATSKCEVHGIGMDSQTASVDANRMFVVHGSNWGIHEYMDHSGQAGRTSLYYRPWYRIPIGSHYTGAMTHMVFINDDDTAPIDSASTFGHIRNFDAGPSQVNDLTFGGRGGVGQRVGVSATSHNLSSRPLTEVRAAWTPPAWETGEMGAAQMTPNLAGVVQEIVDRDGWTNGNAIAFLITGMGRRVVDASDKAWGMKPELNIVWSSPDANLDGDGLPDAWERAGGGVRRPVSIRTATATAMDTSIATSILPARTRPTPTAFWHWIFEPRRRTGRFCRSWVKRRSRRIPGRHGAHVLAGP